LKVAISENFGSFEEMKKKFTEAALTRFGSGWAWLGVKSNGELAICSTANQGKTYITSYGLQKSNNWLHRQSFDEGNHRR
jgi:superoxide dismutase